MKSHEIPKYPKNFQKTPRNPKKFQKPQKIPKNPRKSGIPKSKVVFSNTLRSYFQVLQT
jgi:hypothetical protein